MKLTEKVEDGQKMLERGIRSESAWRSFEEEYVEILNGSVDVEDMIQAIQRDDQYGYILSVQLRFKTHQRLFELLAIGKHLMNFSNYLIASGPDWDNLAEKMKEVAKGVKEIEY